MEAFVPRDKDNQTVVVPAKGLLNDGKDRV